MCLRVPLGISISCAALDVALGRSMTLGSLGELDPEVGGRVPA